MSSEARALRLSFHEEGPQWRWPVLIALGLQLLLLGLGYLNQHDSLLDLIAKGETEAQLPQQPQPMEQEVLLDPTPPPPPVANPDFVAPQEVTPPKPTPPPPKPQPVVQSADKTVSMAPATFHVGDKNCPTPPYPYEAKVNHDQGTVMLSLSVVDGRIVDAQVVGSSGHELLDTSTLQWVRAKWNFPPDITRTLNLPVKFQLAGG